MTPKQDTPKVSDLIGTEDAAKLLGVTTRTIQRMVKDGRLTSYERPLKGRGRAPVLLDRNQVKALKQVVIEVKPED